MPVFAAGHVTGSRIAHLTHTILVADALCGEIGIDRLGEPDLAVVCEECESVAVSVGESTRVEHAPILERAA